MLTVWSVCNGDKYDDYTVQRLQQSVLANLQIPHTFVCVTDRQIEGVYCREMPDAYPGWWNKVQLFREGWSTEQNLYFDLDVVITGSLDAMVMRYGHASCAMPNNWAASGHGGCQSSVMLWTNNYNVRQINDLFDPAIAHWPPVNKPGVLWGDQEWITTLRDSDRVQVVPIAEGIKSYKYHCRNGLPDETKVVVFHGDPKPSNVSESWLQW